MTALLAHGLGGRTDLPLPVWMFAYGAAFTVVISFAALTLFWPASRLEGAGAGRTLAGPGGTGRRALVAVIRLVGVASLALILAAAAFGEDAATTNLAPVAVYVVFWVGLTFASGLIGDVWRVLSPFDTLAGLFGWRGTPAAGQDDTDGSAAGGPDEDTDEPASGFWPAALGLLVFVWVELVYPDRAEPRVLFVLLVAYTATMLACAAIQGRQWLRSGEAFAALFGTLAHAAPLWRDQEGRILLRPPFVGLAGLVPRPGLEAVVLVALGSTTFDGLSRTQLWTDATGGLSGLPAVLAGTAGLLWAVGLVAVAYFMAMRVAAHLVEHRMEAGDLRPRFVHSLVPIVLAYAVAHYFSLLVLEGQAAIALVSDPLDRGWDLFGTAGGTVDFTLVSPRTVAYVQCAAIVIGHVAGVVLAHDRALALFDKRLAARSQYPLLVVMVVFTVGGLSLLLGG